MKDSPEACSTLGLNLTTTKLAVFALSSALAGVAGVFYGGIKGQVGPSDFEFLPSLVLLLLVSISGINTVTGALMGGVTFGIFPKIQELIKLRSLTYIGAGLGALGLGRNPNGWTSDFKPLGDAVHRVIHGPDRRTGEAATGGEEIRGPAPAGAAPATSDAHSGTPTDNKEVVGAAS